MIELTNKRSYSAKHYDKGNGEFVMDSHAGHIHYRGTDGELKDVDYTFEDMGAYWQMVKHNYRLFVAKNFGDNNLIRFDNRFRGANHSIYYEPKMLAWVNNENFSDIQVFRNQQNVQGEIINGRVIRYTNAFGNGLHFEITLLDSGVKKEIVIDDRNNFELPPTANHRLVVLCRYRGDGLVVRKTQKLTTWDNNNYFEADGGFKLEEADDKKSFIRPAYIEDSGILLNQNRQLLKIFWKRHNDSLWQAKVLPRAFLQNAVYPVRADATTDYYVPADAADVTIYRQNEATWAGARGGSTGTRLDSVNAYGFASNHASLLYRCFRHFSTFDTSLIGVGHTVTAVVHHMYIYDGTDTGESLHVVSASPNNSRSYVDGDYDNLSFTSGGSATYASLLPKNNWRTLTFNSTGYGWINVTGDTTVAFISDFDLDNNTPTTDNYITWGQRNASNKPYLRVTYTTGSDISKTEDISITENTTQDNQLAGVNPGENYRTTVEITY